jgi:hypothetical protein
VSRTDLVLVQPDVSELALLPESSMRNGLTIERFTDDLDTMYELIGVARVYVAPSPRLPLVDDLGGAR